MLDLDQNLAKQNGEDPMRGEEFPKPLIFLGGRGRNRTDMRLPSAVFETAASTVSATRPFEGPF